MATKKRKKERPNIKTVLPKEHSALHGFAKIFLWTLILLVASIIISYIIS